MKITTTSLFLLCLALSSVHCAIDYDLMLKKEAGAHKELFEQFQREYNKQYTSKLEEFNAFMHFKENLDNIARVQAKDSFATYSISKFSDLSPQQFENKYLSPMPEFIDYEVPTLKDESAIAFGVWDFFNWGSDDEDVSDLPVTFDWRDKKIITEPKSVRYIYKPIGVPSSANKKKTCF